MHEADATFRCPCGDPLLDPLLALLEPTLGRAHDGQLTSAEANELASGLLAQRLLPALKDDSHASTLSRALYQQHVSWCLVSSEWLDALASELRSRGRTRVLEVAAGSGVLAAPMMRRGLRWRTTDSHPTRVSGVPGEQVPVACDAQTALARFADEVDVVFWAWWPRDDQGDADLAVACEARGLPVIFVGEPRAGCTGSEALWDREPAPQPIGFASCSESPVDVPHWVGGRDRTWVIGSLDTCTSPEGPPPPPPPPPPPSIVSGPASALFAVSPALRERRGSYASTLEAYRAAHDGAPHDGGSGGGALLPLFPPAIEEVDARRGLPSTCATPFLSTEAGVLPHGPPACVEELCARYLVSGASRAPPNVDVDFETVELSSNGEARRVLARAADDERTFWAAVHVPTVAHPPWWPAPRRAKPVPGFEHMIVGCGAAGIGMHRDRYLGEAGGAQGPAGGSAAPERLVSTYLALGRGRKHVVRTATRRLSHSLTRSCPRRARWPSGASQPPAQPHQSLELHSLQLTRARTHHPARRVRRVRRPPRARRPTTACHRCFCRRRTRAHASLRCSAVTAATRATADATRSAPSCPRARRQSYSRLCSRRVAFGLISRRRCRPPPRRARVSPTVRLTI